MDTHSLVISPDAQYRQALQLIMTESEISDLLRFLTEAKRDYLYWPKVAEELRMELRYMLIEVREFNACQKQEDKP